MRGRKPKQESRGTEIRARLAGWKQMPESRPSLRTLARELGTSHQLLSHYLEGLEKWQAQGQAEGYRREAEEIRVRAEAENRPMTPWEEQRVNVCHRQASAWAVEALLNDTYRKLRRQAKRGQLPAGTVKMLRFFARRGVHQAQEILEKMSGAEKSENNLPLPRFRAAKSFRFA